MAENVVDDVGACRLEQALAAGASRRVCRFPFHFADDRSHLRSAADRTPATRGLIRGVSRRTARGMQRR